VEIWDDQFSGTAEEVDGNYMGVSLVWEGEQDTIGPVMASSATAHIVIKDVGGMSLINALYGAKRGRFKMVLRKEGSSSVYWAGKIQTDKVSHPNDFYPFHLELFATDGIADLVKVDYYDVTWNGRKSIMEHIVNIVGKLDNFDVGTWPTNLYRSTCNKYANGMTTAESPLTQALVHHDRYHDLDREGNERHWSCYAVLADLMQSLGCQFLLEGGKFHIRQVVEYKNATQKAHYFDDTGALATTVSAENLDRAVDYATAGAMRFEAGGLWTALPPLRAVYVDYHHMTSNDKGQGQTWGTADETYHTLPGAVTVDAADETILRASLKIRHKSTLVVIPPGSQPYPDHRLRFSVQIRMEDNASPGDYYYLKRVAGAATPFFDIQPEEMEWFFNGADSFTVWAQPINDFDNGIEYQMLLAFTTPSLPEEVSGSNIEMKIELLGAEKPNGGDITIDGISLQGSFSWYTQGVSVKVENEGDGEAGNATIRYPATTTGDNVEDRFLDVYIGDGPAPFSLSAIWVGETATTLWKTNGTGTGLPLGQLLAKDILSYRQLPQRVFQGNFLHRHISPLTRFVDTDLSGSDRAYMATSIRLDGFENRWSGEFVEMDADVDGIATGTPWTPTHQGPHNPETPQGPAEEAPLPDGGDLGGFVLPPFDGLQGGTLPGYVATAEQSPTKLTTDRLAADFNNTALSDDHELTIAAVSFAFAKKGDIVSVVNAITGHREEFTLRESYVPGATVLKLKTSETMVKDFPYGSFVKLSPRNPNHPTTGSFYEVNVTGTGTGNKVWQVDENELVLPDSTDYDAKTLRERVTVVMGGTTLVYDANNYDHAFGIKPGLNQIEVYLGILGVPMFVRVT
jgi:hypothetical protein